MNKDIFYTTAYEEARSEIKLEIIIEMLKNNLPIDKIAQYTKTDKSEIKQIELNYFSKNNQKKVTY